MNNNDDIRFVNYYTAPSQTNKAANRAKGIMDVLLRTRKIMGLNQEGLAVADIGCNSGAQSRLWLENKHTVCGIDISSKLINIAKDRNKEFANQCTFDVCSATKLPWADNMFDICLLPEILEHVDDWNACLKEAIRVLKPGGSIFLSTTNVLCPIQQEYDLPLYSWYPPKIKRYFERKSVTTSPHLVNFTNLPAVHWFNPYFIKNQLDKLGVTTLDRFDLIDRKRIWIGYKFLVYCTLKIPPMRFIGHVLTPSTTIIGNKRSQA